MDQDRVLATYLIETPHALEHAATVIAGEQSSGTFVSIPGETSELKERFSAQVLRIEALDIHIAVPPSTFSTWPATNEASSEVRKAMTAAISSA